MSVLAIACPMFWTSQATSQARGLSGVSCSLHTVGTMHSESPKSVWHPGTAHLAQGPFHSLSWGLFLQL